MATEIPANEAEFTLGDVAAACGGTLEGAPPEARARGVCTDTRSSRDAPRYVARRSYATTLHDYRGADADRHALASADGGRAGALTTPRTVPSS